MTCKACFSAVAKHYRAFVLSLDDMRTKVTLTWHLVSLPGMVPMFPHALAEGPFSLRAGEPSPAMSLGVVLHADGMSCKLANNSTCQNRNLRGPTFYKSTPPQHIYTATRK